jgi:aurora kinase
MEANPNNFLPPCSAVLEGLEPEAKITDFEQIANLGTGGYGKVNLYRHKVTGAEYAIKLIDKTKFENKLQKELFAREVDMMYKIRHPNIVRLYTHFEDETNCYIALEYIKKGNLYSYTQSMPNKVLDAATTAHFVVDLISSLYYLHNMNPPIIHRDIKPENLLVGNNGQLKLTDFGGSNYLEGGNVRYTTCGTQIYHSPEMLLKKGYDTRVDIWAIGILIFELMVGRPPFKSDGQHSMEDNIVHLRINWPSTMNLLAKNLVSKLLKLEPDQRLTLKEILEHQFILTYVENPTNRLILPSEVIIKPFVISKQLPGEEYKTVESTRVNNNSSNFRYSENEEYKSLYEKLKITYEKLAKNYEELSLKKQENDNKNNQNIKFLKQSKSILVEDLEKRMAAYLELKKKLAIDEEEIKRLKQQNNLLNEKYNKIEKELKNSENNYKLKVKKYKDDIRLYQEKINEIFKGTYSGKNNIETNLSEYSDDNMVAIYKKENDNLKQQNSNLLKVIEDLNERILGQEDDLKSKEAKGNAILLKLLKDNEMELEKKNRIINKLYNVMTNIGSFMNKIKMNNFTFTFDGNNINNLEHFKKLMANSQSNLNLTTRSNSNSKDDGLSNKRKTNIQSNSGSINYFQ